MSGGAARSGYEFAPHERPMMPGSPATPDHPLGRRLAYAAIGMGLAVNGGLLNGLLLANLPQMQALLGLTPVEATWLTIAYIVTNVASGFMLTKFRQQFGIQHFLRFILLAFVMLTGAQLFVRDFGFELVLRGFSGIVGSGLTAMGLLYIMQSLPAKARLGSLIIGVGLAQIAVPFARVFSPLLLDQGNMENVFLFEFGTTLICLAAVAALPLPRGDRINAFRALDFLTLALYITAFSSLAAVLSLGRIVWWPTEWIGWALAVSVIALGGVAIVEIGRVKPVFEIRWIGTGTVIRFVIVASIIRLLLSEQTFGASGLLSAVGMGSDQLVSFYVVVLFASLAGIAASLATLNPKYILVPGIVSAALIAIAAFIDSGSTAQTRPTELYVTQAMLAFAATYMIGPTMMSLLLKALAQGSNYILSFSAVFGLSQQIGGAFGAALLGTFQIVRERFYSQVLTEQIILTNPQVATRLAQYSGARASTLTDPMLRSASGASTISQQISQQANILAFNDVFLLIGTIAVLTFVYLGLRQIGYAMRGTGPVNAEIEAMAQQMKGAQA